MKTVGIIGGLGPETTAKFIMRVSSLCGKRNRLQRPEVIVINISISLRLEKSFINRMEGKRELCKLLIDAAKKLEQNGADFLVIPCNTAYIFINQLRKSVRIPIVNLIDESANILKANKVGLLATPASIKNRLFDEKIKIVKPDRSDQKELGKIICRILNNRKLLKDKKRVFEIIENFPEKPDVILLACTDLQLLIKEKRIGDIKVLDTMEILAKATAKEILS